MDQTPRRAARAPLPALVIANRYAAYTRNPDNEREEPMMISLALRRRLSIGVLPLLAVGANIAMAQSQWETVSKTTRDEISIARGSALVVSRDVVSIWVQHRGADGSVVAERHEINCGTQQRRLLELWSRPDLRDSAPTAIADSSWTRTEPSTPMRELVLRTCSIPRREPVAR